jgi:two-component system, NarL family, response regulator NreC
MDSIARADQKIKILIAEDQGLIMHSLTIMLNAQPDFEVTGTASNAEELLRLLEIKKPDVIITDIKMPGMTGIELTRIIDLKMPWIKIIALSMYVHPQFIREMLKAGAKGYLSKNCTPDELFVAIRDVYIGKTVFCKIISEVLITNFSITDEDQNRQGRNLTGREIELIHLLAEGKSTREIANQLYISEKTVERHKSNILKKMKLHNTAQLIKTAVENGILIL